jgi:hypothetical protein
MTRQAFRPVLRTQTDVAAIAARITPFLVGPLESEG